MMLERPPPSPGALRARRARRRQKRGELLVTVALTADETAKLHKLGYLELDQLEDRAAIAAAVRALLGNIVGM
jgi:hypothetical protein